MTAKLQPLPRLPESFKVNDQRTISTCVTCGNPFKTFYTGENPQCLLCFGKHQETCVRCSETFMTFYTGADPHCPVCFGKP